MQKQILVYFKDILAGFFLLLNWRKKILKKYSNNFLSSIFRPWMMESNTNDEEAPKDPGASKALTGLQDNDIFGKLDRFVS